MKKYLFTIVLVILIIFGAFVVFKNKKVYDKLNKIVPKKTISRTSTTELEKKIEKEKPGEQGLTLELISPTDKNVVNTSKVTVSGKTSPNAEVFVNEKELKADASGNFSVDYDLFEGENEIFVAVNDSLGNYAEKSITVYLETNE